MKLYNYSCAANVTVRLLIFVELSVGSMSVTFLGRVLHFYFLFKKNRIIIINFQKLNNFIKIKVVNKKKIIKKIYFLLIQLYIKKP